MKKYFIMLVFLLIKTQAQELQNASVSFQQNLSLINLLYNLDTSNLDPQKPDAFFDIFVWDVLNILREFELNVRNSESIRPLIYDLIARKSKEEIKNCLANLSPHALI